MFARGVGGTRRRGEGERDQFGALDVILIVAPGAKKLAFARAGYPLADLPAEGYIDLRSSSKRRSPRRSPSPLPRREGEAPNPPNSFLISRSLRPSVPDGNALSSSLSLRGRE